MIRPEAVTANPSPAAAWTAQLERLKREGLGRRCVPLDGPPGPFIEIGGRRYLHLCSNNYLGLAGHPAVVEAACEAARRWGVGAGSARLVTGTSALVRELEAELARFKGAEAALVFSSGYLANLGLITAVAGPGDWLLCDRLNHASLIDACRLSLAEVRVYPHADAEAAERLLERAPERGRKFIVTDGVFSMDGDLAPLATLQEAADRHGACLIVDDAHGTGVAGPQGRGAAAACGLSGERLIQVVTLSKALGSQGGAVVGPQALIDLLVHRARPFIFETALSPVTVAAARAALRLVETDEGRRGRLAANAACLRRALAERGIGIPDSATPILPVIVGENARAVAVAEALAGLGYWVTPIRPPSVPVGAARLRVSVMSEHDPADLDRFAEDLAAVLGSIASRSS